MRTIGDGRLEIGDSDRKSPIPNRKSARVYFGVIVALFFSSCSGSYEIRLSDDRSASYGELFFFGWADPPLIPGTRLTDAPPGSRLVLWNEAGLEAIVDLGETCPVLVRDGDGARAPTEIELAVIAAVFLERPLAPSTRGGDYAGEPRLERRFPSHVRSHVEKLGPAEVVEFALGDAPAGWMSLGGRTFALARAASVAAPLAFGRILDRAAGLEGEDRHAVLRALLARPGLAPADLLRLVAAGEAEKAVAHPAADERVCLAAIEAVAKEPLSARRRRGLEAILASPGATPQVREKVLDVPLAYPEDREAVRARAAR